jgi:hypothetical protein
VTGATAGSKVHWPTLGMKAPEARSERNQKTTWKDFLNRHWEIDCGGDFFTTEVWTSEGPTCFLVLFFIDLYTRKVEIAGIASRANGLWMSQVGRRATDWWTGFSTASAF